MGRQVSIRVCLGRMREESLKRRMNAYGLEIQSSQNLLSTHLGVFCHLSPSSYATLSNTFIPHFMASAVLRVLLALSHLSLKHSSETGTIVITHPILKMKTLSLGEVR